MSDLQAQIRQFLSSHSLKLNTDLGQHFLVDQEVLDRIVEAAKITDRDHIVEIGPGIGVLTRELRDRSNTVTAIELDERMIPLIADFLGSPISDYESGERIHLKSEDASAADVSIIPGNALEVPMPETPPYKIVANIPYHITSPLLRHIYMESPVQPVSTTLLIQKEVADRICDEKDAGLLTIIVRLFGAPSKICDVPPGAFIPPPKVDSAVIHIESHLEPIADAETIDAVMKYAKIAFSQKRKMLRNSFGTFQGGLDLLKAADIDENRRPQTLSVEEWIAIAQAAK